MQSGYLNQPAPMPTINMQGAPQNFNASPSASSTSSAAGSSFGVAAPERGRSGNIKNTNHSQKGSASLPGSASRFSGQSGQTFTGNVTVMPGEQAQKKRFDNILSKQHVSSGFNESPQDANAEMPDADQAGCWIQGSVKEHYERTINGKQFVPGRDVMPRVKAHWALGFRDKRPNARNPNWGYWCLLQGTEDPVELDNYMMYSYAPGRKHVIRAHEYLGVVKVSQRDPHNHAVTAWDGRIRRMEDQQFIIIAGESEKAGRPFRAGHLEEYDITTVGLPTFHKAHPYSSFLSFDQTHKVQPDYDARSRALNQKFNELSKYCLPYRSELSHCPEGEEGMS